MQWPWAKPPPPPLIEGDRIDLKALSPQLAGILKTCLGKLDLEGLGEVEQGQVIALYDKLEGVEYKLVTKGMFDAYGAPIDHIKAIPPNLKRK